MYGMENGMHIQLAKFIGLLQLQYDQRQQFLKFKLILSTKHHVSFFLSGKRAYSHNRDNLSAQSIRNYKMFSFSVLLISFLCSSKTGQEQNQIFLHFRRWETKAKNLLQKYLRIFMTVAQEVLHFMGDTSKSE